MRKRRGTSFRRRTLLTLPAISPPHVIRGRFVGSHPSDLAGCKPPPLFMRGVSSCIATWVTATRARGRLSTTECTESPYHRKLWISSCIVHCYSLLFDLEGEHPERDSVRLVALV